MAAGLHDGGCGPHDGGDRLHDGGSLKYEIGCGRRAGRERRQDRDEVLEYMIS